MTRPSAAPGPPRLGGIELVRGVAALAVCWFHLTNGDRTFLPDGWVKTSGVYGYLGIEMFFVVSGFVIPLTLWTHQFQLRSYGRFIAKRLMRLEPPYLASVALALVHPPVAALLSPHGTLPPVEVGRVAAHVVHLWPWLGFEALNPVYWTLVIELQFYLLCGLVFAWWSSRDQRLRIASTLGFAALAFVVPPDPKLVTSWLPFFALGTCGLHLHTGLSKSWEFMGMATVLAVVAGVTTGPIEMIAAVAALAICLSARIRIPPAWAWMSAISYSLYLVHSTVWHRFLNWGMNHPDASRAWMPWAALVVSIVVAWGLWVVVERPAKAWASRMTY